MMPTDAWKAAMLMAHRRQPVARGSLPTDQVLTRGPFRLLHYLPDTSPRRSLPPILMVYSLVNRPDLLDLSPRRSLVRDLCDAGYPVYLVDWGRPLEADRALELEDYTPGFIGEAVGHVSQVHDQPPVLLGICQGGTLGLCYASLKPDTLRLMVTIGTPVDFHAGDGVLTGLASAWPMPRTVSEPVNGNRLSAAFTAIRPVDLLVRRYRQLPEIAADEAALDDFLRMEAWMYDCPDQPGLVFHRFLNDFYLNNLLVRDALELHGQPIRLQAITAPVLNIFASQDHLVPPESASSLRERLPRGAGYQEEMLPGGHLGMFLSRGCRQRMLTRIQESLGYL
ncbi:MAG: alpha/beta fold hydrolase [Ectothiorhodospiraceae bacterium]|nr:alpha/beta fold hydrolase [Ectothiorhodospiraceae bacterium]